MYVVYLSINVSLTSVISKQQDEYANTPDEPSQKTRKGREIHFKIRFLFGRKYFDICVVHR